MAGNQPVLDVSDLTVLRDGNPLLSGLSWQIGRGEHWALLGPNGSGKTSLLSALTGYLMPTRGEIVVMGERFGGADWRELRKQIGFVSSSLGERIPGDEPAVETVVTGKEATINHWGRISQADHREAFKILKKVNATAYADRAWATLSQGERQRILIGRALMARPNLLILDEPCAGLDPVAREHFLAFLDQLLQRRTTPHLILVTHHVEEIVPSITHALVLKQGSAVAKGAKQMALTSETLSDAFDAPIKLRRRQGRYSLEISSQTNRVL